MKMIKYLLAIVILFTVSCKKNFLDKAPLDKPSNEAFWNTDKDALAAAAGCYYNWWLMDNVLYFDCASDNAYDPFPWEGWSVQASGAATPSDYGSNFFSYSFITNCNNFLANISRPTMDETLRKRLTAEVRFLRAWDYFYKVVLYGDAPLITQVLSIANSKVARTPKADVENFILNELSAITYDLPAKYSSSSDVGRITRGAALALKARLQLFMGNYADCAKTCDTLINNKGTNNSFNYSLFPDYKGLFKIANEENSEVVLEVEYIPDLYPDGILGVLPPASSGGWCSINPTQSLVDAYECTDGKTIDQSPLYNPDQPYMNRDPRLDISLIRPGSLYSGSYYNPIDVNSADYYFPYGNSKTGYLVRKYVDNLADYTDMWNNGMNAMVIRYAEILLMYAEAKIESNQIDASVYNAINMVRNRAGMPNVDQSVYNNQATLRTLLRRERRVELAMEGLRWFDIIRWQIGPQVLNGNVYGARLGTVNATNGALTLNSTRIFVETRTFDPAKNYLWPIPQSVIDASAPVLKQNPNY